MCPVPNWVGRLDDRVLLVCIRAARHWADPGDERVLTDAGVDWKAVAEAAVWHRLAPLVYRGLTASEGLSAVPTAEADRLKALYVQNLLWHTRRAAELEEVLLAFASEGVDAMLLKGAALIDTVYENPAERQMADIDLLVREERMADADSILRGREFGPPLEPEDVERIHEAEAALPELSRGSLTLDVHDHLARKGSILDFDTAGLWSRAQEGRWRSAPCLRPAPEDLLVHVCLHSLKQGVYSGHTLAHLVDVAGIVERFGPGLDWDLIAGDAAAHGYGPGVALVVQAAGAIFGPMPDADAMRLVAPQGVDDRLVQRFIAHRALRAPWWASLERVSVASHPLRQLLPPSRIAVRREGARSAYSTWLRAAAQAARRPAEIREAHSLYQSLYLLARRPGEPGPWRQRMARGVWRRSAGAGLTE